MMLCGVVDDAIIKVGCKGDLIIQVTPMFIVWGILGCLGAWVLGW